MPASSGTRRGNGGHSAGHGGPAQGLPPRKERVVFTADNQPTPEAKADGQADARAEKAAMRAFFSAKRMAYAVELDDIALNDADRGRRLSAINSIIDRLDGRATQAVSGPDDGPIESVLRIECDGLKLATRFGSLTSPASSSEPTTNEPSDTP